jgi:ubiquinone/menaquinone biosynthesis C-methylase UbiE
MVEMDNPFTRANRAAVILDHLDLAPGMTLLDAGCGPGRITLPAAGRVGPAGEVLALDLQQGMLDRVRAKAGAAGLAPIRLLRAGLGDGQLPPDHFDRAVLVTVLGEIPDAHAALAELHTALKPDGLLAITEVIFDPHFQRRSTVADLAAAAGFALHAFHGRPWAYTAVFRKG